MMTKNKTTAGIILSVGLILFSIIFFAFPTVKGASFWISYFCGIVAILGQLAICFLAWEKAVSMKSKFMGVPLLIVGYRFLLFQITSSLIFLALSIFKISIPFYLPLVINIIILGTCIVLITVIDISRDEINRVDENTKKKIDYIRSLQVDIETLISKTDDITTKKALTDLAEKIRCSDPKSNDTLSLLEDEISSKISKLKIASSESLINEILVLIEERNNRCRLLK